MNKFGELIAPDTVRFERMLPGPIERVWAYLTESDKRAQWFCSGETELRVGGHIDMHFDNSQLSPLDDVPPPESCNWVSSAFWPNLMGKRALRTDIVMFPLATFNVVERKAPSTDAVTWPHQCTASPSRGRVRCKSSMACMIRTHSRSPSRLP